jgi:Recombination directionality factor-like
MAILSLQRRLAEVGRIRLGQQIETKGGKKRPAALTTFRLTSTDRSRIEEAAGLYKGAVTKWDAPNGLPAWEVITEADKLPVVVPPSAMAFSQHYELWSAGGCQRRCDGVKETLSEQACLCDPEKRECEIHTRLSVMLRDLSGLGVWRVDTQGYYAAVELQGAVEVINLAAGKGQMLPATLRLDPRTIKREGDTKKNFVVPVLDIDVSPAQLLMGTVGTAPAITERTVPLTPVPDGGPPPSIADQVKASDEQPSRRRNAPIPTTGIAPRTAAQRDNTPPSDDPWGTPEGQQDDPYAALDAARDADQDQPRMVTTAQLQKLGILLGKLGFDSTKEGRQARLDFCRAAVKQLMPDSPIAGREITSSKDLTLEEASKLIEMLQAEEAKAKAEAETGEPTGGTYTVGDEKFDHTGEAAPADTAGDDQAPAQDPADLPAASEAELAIVAEAVAAGTVTKIAEEDAAIDAEVVEDSDTEAGGDTDSSPDPDQLDLLR